MTWTESAIAASLAGKFYRVTTDGRITTAPARKPQVFKPYTGQNAKWSEADNETLIRLHRAGASTETIRGTIRRNNTLINIKIKELVSAGVLQPRRKGNWKT